MVRLIFFAVTALLLFWPRFLAANEEEGPAISITSPDTATTFAFGTVKSHSLIWDKKSRMLLAEVTFTDAELNFGQSNDDTHQFRLPGVTLDAAKGIFFASSAKGESIPVAHFKKVLLFTTIETLPNAVVRILHPGGNVTVILEAISPSDPAMHAPPPDTSPDDTHKADILH